MSTTTVPATDARIRGLRHRAESLRVQAAALTPVLGETYRRRAQELDLEAHLLELREAARRSRIG
jgi:hypothetical protein